VLAIERLPPVPAGDRPLPPFDWERILRRKSELAARLDAHWFIHHDADEFRESPWPGLSLKSAIQRVDAIGYSAVDFTSLDFRPVDDTFRPGTDVRTAFHYYTLHPHDRLQIRCWKKTGCPVDLVSSGGHEAEFPGRSVFPMRFILRHYPVRGQAHGERKVFQERQGRYVASERARGWHVQYDEARPGHSFIADPSTLTRYDPDAVRLELALRHRGVEALEEAVAAARAETATIDARLATRERELAALHQAHQRRERDLARLAGELRQAHAALEEAAAYCASLQSALAAAESVNADAKRYVAALDSTLEAHREALDVRLAEIEQWRQALDAATRELQDLRGSLSWRMMAPVRALFRAMKGR
jgi:hypothetical protein